MADIEIGVGKDSISNDRNAFEFITYGEVIDCDSYDIKIDNNYNIIETNTQDIDIEINIDNNDLFNDKNIIEFATNLEVSECDNTNIEIDYMSNTIESSTQNIDIEISGLKTIQKFIGLEDTPLYYDNGKFFKVENNRIVYADLTWQDISGNIDDNPQLKEYLFDIVQKADEGYVDESIDKHNNNKDAHPSIQSSIKQNYDYLNSKIELNKIDIDAEINEVDKKIDNNKNKISALDEYAKNLNDNLEALTLTVNVDITNDINGINNSLQSLDKEVDGNFETLNSKIGTLEEELETNITNVESQISDLDLKINTNYNDLNTRVGNNTESVKNLNVVTSNNTQLINQTIDNLKQYSKTTEFSKVAFTGQYEDLLNVPQNLATTEFVTNEILENLKNINTLEFLIVEELPEVGENKYIYLLYNTNTKDYDEYFWIAKENRFELIGTTDIDLSNFYKKDEVNNLLSNKVDKEDGKSLISDTEIVRLSGVTNYDDTEIKNILSDKQDKLTAGKGIEILDDGTINNTQTSAEWGNIIGSISNQADLQNILSNKVDKENGKSLISDTEIVRLSGVTNYDDTEIKESVLYLENNKQNKLIAGENVELKNNEDNTVLLNVNMPDVITDDVTIIKNNDKAITAIGLKTKSDNLLYDWIGTLEEYETGISNGSIGNDVRCMITDDEEPILEQLPTATITELGIVKPDGNTITIEEDGTIKVLNLDAKQDKLVAGNGVDIIDNVISGTTIVIRDWSV